MQTMDVAPGSAVQEALHKDNLAIQEVMREDGLAVEDGSYEFSDGQLRDPALSMTAPPSIAVAHRFDIGTERGV
jgi:hypothetical protein